MNRIALSETVEMSQIVYGMWRLGDDTDTSQAHVQAKVEACIAQGITTMDQADIYGGYAAEALFGETLKAAPALRDQIEIVTKCDIVAPMGKYADARVKYYDTSAAHITASVEASLRLMNIEVIDCLLIHRPDPFMDHRETGAVLDKLIESGKIRSAGVSNFRPWDFSLLQSGMENDLVTNQIEISVTHHTPFTDGDLAFLQENEIPAMAWSPLGGGALFSNADVMAVLSRIAAEYSVEPSAVAVAFLLAHPADIMPVMGTNNISRIKALSDALKVDMDRQTWFEIYTASLGHEVA